METSAINSDKLNALKSDLTEYVEKIHSVLGQIDNQMDIIETNISDDLHNQIKNKYDSIKSQYKIIEDNLLSYSSDISNLIMAFENQDRDLANKLMSDIDKINF